MISALSVKVTNIGVGEMLNHSWTGPAEMWRDLLREALITIGVVRRPDMALKIMDHQPAPRDLLPGTLIVVEGGGKKKWVCFQCPGGCGNRFQLSLNPSQHPRWTVDSDILGRPTIHPSIHQHDACRAHFWVRAGRIEWCSDSGHQTTSI